MPVYEQVSFNKFCPSDGIIITCYCGGDEKIEVEESISMEKDSEPDMFSFTVTRRVRCLSERLKEAWDVLRGRSYPYTDYVLIDEDAARVLADWINNKLSGRV
jgi:hypothetical protein